MDTKFFEKTIQDLGLGKGGLEFLLRVRDEAYGDNILPHEEVWVRPYINARILERHASFLDLPDFMEPLSHYVVRLTPFGGEFLKFIEKYHEQYV
ncbi:hypothetical protein GOV10_05940 [Candidatus Woesearchaeota archaeon]|nr:hypothetical protein [Candidatus Woesearchaeota archaeon]